MKSKSSKPAAKKIETKAQYDATMKSIYTVMRKGEKNLSAKELARLKAMAKAAENFEDFHFPLLNLPVFLK